MSVNLNDLTSRELWTAASVVFSRETGYELDSFDGAEPLGLMMDEMAGNVDYNLAVTGGPENELDDERPTDDDYGLTDWKPALAEFFKRQPQFLDERFKRAAKRFYGLAL